jgi:formate-dependent nitrite reductase membrane component NrfD
MKVKGVNTKMNSFALSIDYKEQREWSEVSMWAEMALGAIAGGLFIASTLTESLLGALIALLVMLIGKGGLLVSDLGRPERFLRVLTKPLGSWISRGAWGLGAFALAGAGYIASFFLPMGGVGKLLGVAASLLAGFLIAYDGFFLADSKGVAFWTSGSLPLVFLSNALLGGLGALMLMPLAGVWPAALPPAAMHTALVLLSGFCLFSFVHAAIRSGGGAEKSAALLMSKFSLQSIKELAVAPVFQLGAIVVGLALPLTFSVMVLAADGVGLALWPLVGLCEMVGVVALRYSLLKAGLYSPVV